MLTWMYEVDDRLYMGIARFFGITLARQGWRVAIVWCSGEHDIWVIEGPEAVVELQRYYMDYYQSCGDMVLLKCDEYVPAIVYDPNRGM